MQGVPSPLSERGEEEEEEKGGGHRSAGRHHAGVHQTRYSSRESGRNGGHKTDRLEDVKGHGTTARSIEGKGVGVEGLTLRRLRSAPRWPPGNVVPHGSLSSGPRGVLNTPHPHDLGIVDGKTDRLVPELDTD